MSIFYPGSTAKSMRSGRFVSQLTKSTMAIVMAGGRGERLRQLTEHRAKPATPFGGKYRIIDFSLSNCVNSGIRQILVMTQYKSHSLIQHIQRGWGYLRGELGEFVQLVPAQQKLGELWYRGTADCVYQNLDIIQAHDPELVLVLAGDHVYKMDYGPMIAFHVARAADVTLGMVQVPIQQAHEFGIATLDPDHRIIRFNEKPKNPEPMPGRTDVALASMGIYVFSVDYLRNTLNRDALDPASAHDFGKNIIPGAIGNSRIFAYPFESVETEAQAYWRDVGTVDAFYAANMELIFVSPELNLYDAEWPIWTYQEQTPCAKFVLDEEGRRGIAINSMVAGGCIVSGAVIRESLLFFNVTVNERSEVFRSVVLPHVRIGRGCRISRAILDEGCSIPDGMVIGEDAVLDRQRFHVTEQGVVLVTEDMLRNCSVPASVARPVVASPVAGN
ncbi:MAG: glucose-1-phosphate adenylyltransferase [Gammaproteobacteria bacterium]|nr:glucose-1-phosphate adenylyltransferase [Gammaproteobacteria bacterium]